MAERSKSSYCCCFLKTDRDRDYAVLYRTCYSLPVFSLTVCRTVKMAIYIITDRHIIVSNVILESICLV